MTLRLLLISFVITAAAFAQTTANSITVTASRTISAQPDTVVYQVDVTSSLTAAEQDILSLVQPAGIIASNLTAVNTVQQYSQTGQQTASGLDWSFQFLASLQNMKGTVASLSALTLSAAQTANGPTVSFSVQGTQSSTQQSSACPTSSLISDARTQAQTIANASSMTVGAILAMKTSLSTSVPGQITNASSVTCSLTVKFALGGF
jgi:uncharacterized protein YggE